MLENWVSNEGSLSWPVDTFSCCVLTWPLPGVCTERQGAGEYSH